MLRQVGTIVPLPDTIKSAAFFGRSEGQGDPMDVEDLDYARLSEEAMVDADDAATLDECQKHLHRALRYAQLACLEHQRSPDFNVVEMRRGARGHF
jgi:hypothetical protein